MTKSSWRDDYQRLVPGRAQAYARNSDKEPWQLNMPFMNVYGNGGMLTTVGDWMKWNAMLDSRSLGAPLVEALETQGVLNDGRKIAYALGLTVDKYKGMKDVSHGGSTAGYQTFLARYPEKKLSVGVMCNGTSPRAGDIAATLTDEIVGPYPEQPKPPAGIQVAEEHLKKFVGTWRNEKTHNANRTTFDKGGLRMNGSPMTALSDGVFLLPSGVKVTFVFDKEGKATIAEINNEGAISKLYLEPDWTPTTADLASFAGDWYSEEAGATFTFAVDGDKAFYVQRPSTRIPLRPVFKDHFNAQGYMLWLTRDGSGKVDKLHVGAGRMRDMQFVRVNGSPK